MTRDTGRYQHGNDLERLFLRFKLVHPNALRSEKLDVFELTSFALGPIKDLLPSMGADPRWESVQCLRGADSNREQLSGSSGVRGVPDRTDTLQVRC